MTLRKVFAETVFELSVSDSRLVTVVGDISHGIFRELRENLPNRYFNIGICEPAMLGVAAGLSASGLIPIVHTITPFLIERSYEQIKLDFAYQNLGVNLVSVGGTFEYSKLGCTHHSYVDYSLISKLPNSQVFFPGSEIEFESLFKENYANGKINYYRLTEFPHQVNIGSKFTQSKGLRVINGVDLTIAVSGGPLLKRVMAVVETLESYNISVDLLYFHTLKPFDLELCLESVRKTRKLLTVEEIHSSDGIHALILRGIAGEFQFKSQSLGLDDFIREYGSYDFLSTTAGLDANTILKKSLELLGVDQ
jgi:transketolase